MENDNERINFDNEEYFNRSGCGHIIVCFAIIVLFLLAVGGIYLFT